MTKEDYRKLDMFLMSGLYYTSSKAREKESITIENLIDNYWDDVAYNVISKYCSLKSKTLYIHTTFFKFIKMRLFKGYKFKWARKIPENTAIMDVTTTLSDILCNEQMSESVIKSIYYEYMKRSKNND